MKEKSLMNLESQQKISTLQRLKYLREKLAQVPHKPGVYLHKSETGEILYVGKAKDLVNRLKSYFQGLENHSPKTRALVQKIYDFEVIVTENEYESLLLENNLIKHNKPNYNILLRDDKTYPYIKIDMQEKWPRVTIVRKRKKDGSLYFGPYTISGQVVQLMNVINRFFPLVKCTPTVFKTVSRPCNYYDIKKCLGPCKLQVNKVEYDEHLNNVISILNGKPKDILKKIKHAMTLAAEGLEYEKAAILRDQLKAVSLLTENQAVTLPEEIDIDIIGSYWNEELVSFYVANIRVGKVVGGQSYVIKHVTEEPVEIETLDKTSFEMHRVFSAFVCQYYTIKTVPNKVLFANAKNIIAKESISDIDKYLVAKIVEKEKHNGDIFYIDEKVLLNNSKLSNKIMGKKIHDLIIHANQNAENKFIEHVKMEEASNQVLTKLQGFLGLPSLPFIIECYDISTFQGKETVASQVVFKNAKPNKSQYKKYIIKEVKGQDDFASLREVLRRRFKDREKIQIPNMVLIDGGTPQIREVGWLLKSMGLEQINFFGIAKARNEKDFTASEVTSSFERIIIPKRNENGELFPDAPPETRILKAGSLEFKLLTQLRDEAHRFAITFHRQRRDKSSLRSILSDIKGLGAKRRKILLEQYPNLQELLQINIKEISDKTSIPLHVLQLVIEKIKQNFIK